MALLCLHNNINIVCGGCGAQHCCRVAPLHRYHNSLEQEPRRTWFPSLSLDPYSQLPKEWQSLGPKHSRTLNGDGDKIWVIWGDCRTPVVQRRGSKVMCITYAVLQGWQRHDARDKMHHGSASTGDCFQGPLGALTLLGSHFGCWCHYQWWAEHGSLVLVHLADTWDCT